MRPAARRRSAAGAVLALALPGLALLVAVLVVPVLGLLVQSLFAPGFTTRHYSRLLVEPLYLKVLLATLELSALSTAICLIAGYPVAYHLATVRPATRSLLLIFLLLPFWTSILVKSFAWLILLQRDGIVNRVLLGLGVVSAPLTLIFNTVGMLVGNVHYLLPFMVLPIFSVLAGIDRNVLRAAESLGARPGQQFLRIILPLSVPGVAAGCLMVFVMSLGFYVVPALLGGPKNMMIATLIDFYVRETLNWPFASTLSAVLLSVTLLFVALYFRVFGLERFGARV